MGNGDHLLMNERSFEVCDPARKHEFVFLWLRTLEDRLPRTEKTILKTVQERLVEQLNNVITVVHEAARSLLPRALLRLHEVDRTFPYLNSSLSKCNEVLRREDATLSSKLTAIACLSALYICMGSKAEKETYDESYALLIKWLKIAESQSRAEILNTLRSMITGLGTAANNMHKEMYELTRSYANHRVSSVRIAAIKCLAALVPVFSYMYINDWDQLFTSCVKALEGSTKEVRNECTTLLATMIAAALNAPKSAEPERSSSGSSPMPHCEHPKVACKALQSLTSLLSRKDISTAIVKNLGDETFNVMKPFINGLTVNKMITDVPHDQLLVLQESMKILEILSRLADKETRPPIVTLLTQSLCRLVFPTASDEWAQMSPASRRLHDFAIGCLTTVKSNWPRDYKAILAAHPEFKKRLEGALVFQASRNALAHQTARTKQAENKTANSQQQQPTNKFKCTDLESENMRKAKQAENKVSPMLEGEKNQNLESLVVLSPTGNPMATGTVGSEFKDLCGKKEPRVQRLRSAYEISQKAESPLSSARSSSDAKHKNVSAEQTQPIFEYTFPHEDNYF